MKFWSSFFRLYTSKEKGVMGVLRTTLIRGALFLLPIGVTVFVISYALSIVDQYLGGPAAALIRWLAPDWLMHMFPDGHIPGVSMVLLILVMLLFGAIASWPVGHQGLRLVDVVLLRIPFIGGIFSSVRKIVDTLGESSRFQRAVWFNCFPGTRSIGLVTHEFIEKTTGEKWVWIFHPFVPNPTGGMLLALPERETTPCEIDAKEVFTMMVGMGTTMPAELRAIQEAPPPPPEVK
jgi:uncharacterized membrane protein